jgi:hypothetical protein
MQLEDYFDFDGQDAARVKGHRVGIDLIIDAYRAGKTPHEIAKEFPTIRLEDVFATITYYLHNQQRLDVWMDSLSSWAQQDMADKDDRPSPVGKRLRNLAGQEKRTTP